MADKLRELFDDMVSGEPPMRTTTDSAVAAGRRLRVRHRAMWTVAATALTVALFIAVPTLAVTGRSAVGPAASATGTAPPRPTSTGVPTPATTPAPTASPADAGITQFRHCPQPTTYPSFEFKDGSLLPNVDKAAAAVQTAGPTVAPGKQFILRVHQYFTDTQKIAGHPQNALIFDVGDADGYGFVSFQMLVQKGPTPQEWADNEMDSQSACVDVTRRDYADGSIAISIGPTSAAQAASSLQVYYYSVKGYMLNIGAYTEGWSASDDPATPPPPPPRPVRRPGNLPLTVAQLMTLADVIAHS
jgi:hypothetical protein